ncbi:membrane protein required for colicin V production [Natronospira proteinivora]|uniref:Membrane protein required for colicin V production n=1 Tax=Natronospira proteinivora TaxID=1807133 RepID=A0ABT1G797_9GAMM|nr:CvpA family protein [Natronospira proteinivora]MCP1727096.1 membrane protein required for colicin V production [Natronospira proteinivora]
MVWVDYVIVALVVLSSLISLMRGFVKEALSLATWILAFWVALTFTDMVDAWLAGHIETPSLRVLVAFSALFIVTLVLGAMANHFVSLAVKKTGLSGTDRMIGVLFGLARGVVVVAALVLLGMLTELNHDPWWGESTFIPLIEPISAWMAGFLPENLVQDLDIIEFQNF